MTIRKILNNIEEFERLVSILRIREEFAEFLSLISKNGENIIIQKEIADRLSKYLEVINKSRISTLIYNLKIEDLRFFPSEQIKELKQFSEKEQNVNAIQNELKTILHKLINDFAADVKKVEALKNTLSRFVDNGWSYQQKKTTIVSIIFNHSSNIENLKDFSNSMVKWSKMLPIYHQLILSKTPEDIKIHGLENGSIDLLINLTPEVTKAILEIFKVGVEAFTAYLVYKNTIKELMKTAYKGNERLIESEKVRDEEFKKSIKRMIEDTLKEQHKIAIEADRNISTESIDIKINTIADAIEEHVIKGNEIKLIKAPNDDIEMLQLNADVETSIIERKKQIDQLEPTDWNLLLEEAIKGKK